MRPVILLCALASLGAAPTAAQGANDLILNNGVDRLFVFSDPSIGSPAGTFPPDWTSDLFYKVFPRETVHAPDGDLLLTGLNLVIYDTDWTTSPDFFDMFLSAGIESSLGSGANPGNIEPLIGDPMGLLISPGPSGLPDPCLAPGDPLGCGGPCPPFDPLAGFGAAGYEIDVQLLSPIALDGTSFHAADGNTDVVLTFFHPGGMPFSAGGTCGQGDYVIADAHSTPFVFAPGIPETQADWLGTGYSAYSGFQVGLFPGFTAEGVDESPWGVLQFDEAMLNVTVDPAGGPPLETGLAGINPSVGLGFTELGVQIHADQNIGDLAFGGVSSSGFLPAPVPVFGSAQLLLFPDGLTFAIASSWNGVIGPDGIFTSATVPVPSSSAGLDLFLQGILLDPVTFSGTETAVWTTHLRP